MNRYEADLFAAPTLGAGRKGVAYDWQSLLAADAVAALESELRDLVMEAAE